MEENVVLPCDDVRNSITVVSDRPEPASRRDPAQYRFNSQLKLIKKWKIYDDWVGCRLTKIGVKIRCTDLSGNFLRSVCVPCPYGV